MKRRENHNFIKEMVFKQFLYMDNSHYIDFWNGTVTMRIRMSGNEKYFAQDLGRTSKPYDITSRMTSKLILHMVEQLQANNQWPAIWNAVWSDTNTAMNTSAQIIPFQTGVA